LNFLASVLSSFDSGLSESNSGLKSDIPHPEQLEKNVSPIVNANTIKQKNFNNNLKPKMFGGF
jgi:hypothetical protein